MASSIFGLPPISSELKSITPFLQRADELKNQDPVVAYWCAYYAAQLGIGLNPRSNASRALLSSLLDTLEHIKSDIGANDAISNDSVSSAYMENFALKVFANADNEDRSKVPTRSTAKKFLASANFLEVLRTFPKNEASDSNEEKIRYAKWKAADIAKAVREGRAPTSGPPLDNPEEFASFIFPQSATASDSAIIPPSSSPAGFTDINHNTDSSSPRDEENSRTTPNVVDSIERPIVHASNAPSLDISHSSDIYSYRSPTVTDSGTASDALSQSINVKDEQFDETDSTDTSTKPWTPGLPHSVFNDQFSTSATSDRPQNFTSSSIQFSTPFMQASAPPPPPMAPAFSSASSMPRFHDAVPYVSPAPALELTPALVGKTQRHCRFAISALDYEDAETAKKELRAALALLGG